VTRTTHSLGLVVSDIQNRFFARLARAVADVARQRGYSLILANSDEDLGYEREAVRVLAEKRVDGLIVVPASNTPSSHLQVLMKHRVPIVLLDRSLADLAVDTIMVDNEAAGYRAVRHLTDLGHRRIGMITASTTIATTIARVAGYRKALTDVGVCDSARWLRVAQDNQVSVEAETAALLALPGAGRPTAIFTTDSILTASVFRAMRAAALRIPTDISLVGFDDVDWMSLVSPAVTVVEQPVYELGKRAAERLIRRIEGDDSPVEMICLETELLIRDSCAPPTPDQDTDRTQQTPRAGA
jgi:LacI family transcriptional regulator